MAVKVRPPSQSSTIPGTGTLPVTVQRSWVSQTRADPRVRPQAQERLNLSTSGEGWSVPFNSEQIPLPRYSVKL